MGERWKDADERRRLWHQMLKNADATAYEWDTYGAFIDKRARDAREPSNQRTVKAIANPDNSVPLPNAEKRLKEILKDSFSPRSRASSPST